MNNTPSTRKDAAAEASELPASNPDQRATALTNRAMILCEAGDVTGAIRTAKAISDPYEQAQVLAKIAEAQAAKGYAGGPGGRGAGSATGIGGNLYLTTHEAAAYLRLSSRTLERHRVEGTGSRFVKLGRRVVYRRSDLDDWAASQTFRSTSEADAADAAEAGAGT